MLTLFKSLSLSDKIITILIAIIIIMYCGFSLKLSYANNQLSKQLIEEKKLIEDVILINEQTQDSIIEKGKTINTDFQKQVKQINLKSKEDAEKIDNSDYPISKLDSLLSSYD